MKFPAEFIKKNSKGETMDSSIRYTWHSWAINAPTDGSCYLPLILVICYWCNIKSANGMQLHWNRFSPFVSWAAPLFTSSLAESLCKRLRWFFVEWNVALIENDREICDQIDSNETKVKPRCRALIVIYILHLNTDSLRLWIVTMAFKNSNSKITIQLLASIILAVPHTSR